MATHRFLFSPSIKRAEKALGPPKRHMFTQCQSVKEPMCHHGLRNSELVRIIGHLASQRKTAWYRERLHGGMGLGATGHVLAVQGGCISLETRGMSRCVPVGI